MNRETSRQEVTRYLLLLKSYAGNWIEVKHRSQGADKNYDFMRRYGLLIDDVRVILFGLVVSDYSSGPCPDDKQLPGRSDVWKFGKTVLLDDERVELYLKIAFGCRESGLGCVCIYPSLRAPPFVSFSGEMTYE